MADIATIGLRVDGAELEEAGAAIDRVTAKGVGLEQQFQRMSLGDRMLGDMVRVQQTAAVTFAEFDRDLQLIQRDFDRLNAQYKAGAFGAREMAAAVRELNQSLQAQVALGGSKAQTAFGPQITGLSSTLAGAETAALSRMAGMATHAGHQLRWTAKSAEQLAMAGTMLAASTGSATGALRSMGGAATMLAVGGGATLVLATAGVAVFVAGLAALSERAERAKQKYMDWIKGLASNELASVASRVAALNAEMAKLVQTTTRSYGTYGATPSTIITTTGITDEEQYNAIFAQRTILVAAYNRVVLETVNTRAQELSRLRAINAAYGQSDTALQRLNIEYDRRAQLAQNELRFTGPQLARMNALTNAIARQRVEAVQLNEAARATAGRNAFMEGGQRDEAMAWFNDLKRATDGAIAQIEILNAEIIAAQDEQSQRWVEGRLAAMDRLNNEILDVQEEESAEWVRGVSEKSSVADFFSAKGGNILSGLVSGITSAINPTQYLTSAITDLVGALLGSETSARRAAVEERRLARVREATEAASQQAARTASLMGTAAAMGFTFTSMGTAGTPPILSPITGLEQSLAGLSAQFDDLARASLAAGYNTEELARLEVLRLAVAERLRAEFARQQTELREDLAVRQLVAQGRTDEADAMDLALRQQREYEQAVRDGAETATLAALQMAHAWEAQRAEAERQAADIEERLTGLRTGAEKSRQMATTLREYADSLKFVGASPAQTASLARAEFERVATLAQGGDQAAAGRIPELSRALLEASRVYSASGAGFQRDLAMVSQVTDALAGQFEAQASAEEQQIGILEEQLALLRGIHDALWEEAVVPEPPDLPIPDLPPWDPDSLLPDPLSWDKDSLAIPDLPPWTPDLLPLPDLPSWDKTLLPIPILPVWDLPFPLPDPPPWDKILLPLPDLPAWNQDLLLVPALPLWTPDPLPVPDLPAWDKGLMPIPILPPWEQDSISLGDLPAWEPLIIPMPEPIVTAESDPIIRELKDNKAIAQHTETKLGELIGLTVKSIAVQQERPQIVQEQVRLKGEEQLVELRALRRGLVTA